MDPEMTDEIDWEKTPPETIDFVHRQGLRYLDAQFSAALAADSRATTVASILAALGTASSALTIAYWAEVPSNPILAGGLVAGLAAALGAVVCLYSARPVNLYSSGAEPSAWVQSLEQPMHHAQWFDLQNIQANIAHNESIIAKNASYFAVGSMLGAVSPVIGVAVWAAIYLIF